MLKLIELQSNEGDVEGALKTLEQMQGAYWKALGYCRCAEKMAAGRQQPTGQELRTKAEALADEESEPRNSTDMWVKVAEVAAKAGDLPGARRCLDKALKASRATKDHEHHQWIARCQVRLGMLEDAYATAMAIPQLELRVLPLAELTRETAKREALARKQGQNK